MNATKTGWVANLFGSALLLASGFTDPAVVSQILSYVTALGVAISPAKATAALGLTGLVLNQILIVVARNQEPDNPNVLRQRGFVSPPFAAFLLVLSLAVACVGLSGCSTLSQNVDQSKLIVQVATMKVIESDRGATAERAARIQEIAGDARTFLDGTDVSVALLEDSVMARLAGMDLAPSDRVLASALVAAVVAELNARVGDGLLSSEQRYTVSEVLGWIEQAAEFY